MQLMCTLNQVSYHVSVGNDILISSFLPYTKVHERPELVCRACIVRGACTWPLV